MRGGSGAHDRPLHDEGAGVQEERDDASGSGGVDHGGIIWRTFQSPVAVSLLIALAGFFLSLAVAFMSIRGGPRPHVHSTPTPTSTTKEPTSGASVAPKQTTFMVDVNRDRKTLVPGSFWHPSSARSAVGESTSIAVGLQIDGKGVGQTGPATSPPMGSKIHHIPVGGVEGASLTSPSDEVKIRPLFDLNVKQIVIRPPDWADWEWAVSASEPGDYTLVLRITTYQGQSNRALATSRPISIHLHVANTVSHRVSWVRSELVAWGGVGAAIVALLAFRTPLLAFVRARRDSLLERRRQGQDGYM